MANEKRAAKQIVDSLFRAKDVELRRERSIDLPTPAKAYIKDVLQDVTTRNDARPTSDRVSAVRVLAELKREAIARDLQGELHFWGVDHLDRFCVAELGRISFASAGP